jgi:glycosyltransferase involved in cell wall biosynthesis
MDWTLREQEEMAEQYFGRAPRSGAALALARWRERLLFGATTRFVAMSTWTADSLKQAGVPASRIEVIHPGLDLDWWTPAPEKRSIGRPRLLFVGGDFGRKGGHELLKWHASGVPRGCEIDIVTQAEVEPLRGVRVHQLEPNSPALRELYQRADMFVLPTKADCFGHAAVEAMACGTPVMMTAVGGAGDIVVDGETGWLLRSVNDLGPTLEQALSSPGRLRAMGEAARDRAAHHFDGAVNNRRLANLLLGVAGSSGRN